MVCYSCYQTRDLCDFKTTWQGYIKKHKDSVYGDVRFTCEQRDLKTKRKDNLKTHLDSVHAVKYK